MADLGQKGKSLTFYHSRQYFQATSQDPKNLEPLA